MSLQKLAVKNRRWEICLALLLPFQTSADYEHISSNYTVLQFSLILQDIYK